MSEKIPKLQQLTRRLKKLGRFLACTPLPEILFISIFIQGRYLSNIDFSYPPEVVLPLVIFAVLATVVFYLYKLFLKSVLAAHIASLLLVYGLYSFQYQLEIGGPTAKSLIPQTLATPFVTSLVLVLLLAILYGLIGFVLAKLVNGSKLLTDLQIPKVLIFVVAFLFVAQTYMVVGKLWEIRHQLAYTHQTVIPNKTNKASSKPDIYYLVFDRYGNNETMQNEYGYDNNSIYDFLSTQGFSNREDAYSNYPFTMSSVSSTLSMQYHTELGRKFGNDAYQSAFPYRSILNDPPVAQILKQDGYTYNHLSSWWDFARVNIKADSDSAKSFRFSFFGWHYFMSDLTRDVINKSIFNPLFKKGITIGDKSVIKYDLTRHPRENFEAQISGIKKIASQKHDNPQFTFGHILVPHDPYIYMADGSAPWYDGNRNDSGVDETIKYTNQLTYLNKRIKELIGHIRQASPGAVVIIQADEGPYPKEFRYALSVERHYNTKDLPLSQQKMRFGVFSSYYMPGVSDADVAKNVNASVNPFRFVLSHYLGYGLDMLPDCHFSSGNKFIIYRFTPATQQLRGDEANNACSAY